MLPYVQAFQDVIAAQLSTVAAAVSTAIMPLHSTSSTTFFFSLSSSLPLLHPLQPCPTLQSSAVPYPASFPSAMHYTSLLSYSLFTSPLRISPLLSSPLVSSPLLSLPLLSSPLFTSTLLSFASIYYHSHFNESHPQAAEVDFKKLNITTKTAVSSISRFSLTSESVNWR